MCYENHNLQSLQTRLTLLEAELNKLKHGLSLVADCGRRGPYAYPSPYGNENPYSTPHPLNYGGGYPQGNTYAAMGEEAETDTLEMQVGRLLLTACQKGIRYTCVQVRECKRVVGVIDVLNPDGGFWFDLAKAMSSVGVGAVKRYRAVRFCEHGIRLILPGANHFELTFVGDDESGPSETVTSS